MTAAARATPFAVMRACLLWAGQRCSGGSFTIVRTIPSTIGLWSEALHCLRNFPACQRQHFAGKDAGGMQHFFLAEITERELADEVVSAGFTSHAADLFANRAG